MKGWKWFLIVIVAIAAVVIAVYIWATEEVVEEQELTVLEHELKEGYWGPVVVGTARNDTELELGSAKAKVEWYGPGDVVLGTSFDVQPTGLQPGDTWHFEVRSVVVSYEEVTDYELEVTGTVP
jgi:hypothetical protein